MSSSVNEDKARELIKLVAENIVQHHEASDSRFNIFKILHVTEETKISRVLCEFLNPKGSHGMGKSFLDAFIAVLRDEGFIGEGFEINTEDSIAYREKHIGAIDTNYERGGNIDIEITDGKYAMIIENKFWAVDQPKQLYRYDRYANETYCRNGGEKNYILIYLTPEGRRASDDSAFNNLSYKRIGYELIVKWLDKCLECSSDKIRIKEEICQFRDFINEYIRGYGMDTKLNNKIIEIVKQDLTTAAAIYRSFEMAKKQLVGDLARRIVNKAGYIIKDVRDRGFDRFCNGVCHTNGSCCVIPNEGFQFEHDLTVLFGFDGGYSGLNFGVSYINKAHPENLQMAVKLKEDMGLSSAASTEWWPLRMGASSSDADWWASYLAESRDNDQGVERMSVLLKKAMEFAQKYDKLLTEEDKKSNI